MPTLARSSGLQDEVAALKAELQEKAQLLEKANAKIEALTAEANVGGGQSPQREREQHRGTQEPKKPARASDVVMVRDEFGDRRAVARAFEVSDVVMVRDGFGDRVRATVTEAAQDGFVKVNMGTGSAIKPVEEVIFVNRPTKSERAKLLRVQTPICFGDLVLLKRDETASLDETANLGGLLTGDPANHRCGLKTMASSSAAVSNSTLRTLSLDSRYA